MSTVIGRDIVHLPSVSSTMDVVEEYARAGAAEGIVVFADEQLAGRGRAGRVWMSPPASSVLFSVLLRPSVAPDCLGVLSLLAGVAVAEAIESLIGHACEIKWPNDVWIDGLKVAGVLVQSRLAPEGADFVIVGIGINVSIDEADLPEGATSLLGASGVAVDRWKLLHTVLEQLAQVYDEFTMLDGRVSLDGFRAHAALLGQRVTIRNDGESVTGNYVDVDDRGAIVIEGDNGERVAVAAGDLVRGPRR